MSADYADYINNLQRLYDAAHRAGMKILSDRYCGTLLAWVLVYGNVETGVYNARFNVDIGEARKRLDRGDAQSAAIAAQMRSYIKECGEEKGRNRPAWAYEIEQRYGLCGDDRKICLNAACKISVPGAVLLKICTAVKAVLSGIKQRCRLRSG